LSFLHQNYHFYQLRGIPENGTIEEEQRLLEPSNSSIMPQSEKYEPKDRKNIVYLQFFFLGLSTLLPWNFFITADSYWSEKFTPLNNSLNFTNATTNETSNEHGIHSLYRSCFSICSMLPQILFTFLSTLQQKNANEHRRVVLGLIIMSVSFIVTTVFVKIDTSSFQTTFFVLTLISIFVVNSFSALIQPCLFGFAATFPQRYTQALMSGQGMGGLFAAASLIVALLFTNNPSDYALIFFIIAVVMILLSLFCFLVMEKNTYYRYYRKKSIAEIRDEKDIIAGSTLMNEAITSSRLEITQPGYLDIFLKVKVHFFCLFFTFFVTLANFPSITASVKSTSENEVWRDRYFTPVCCFLIFNFTDFVGRSLPSLISLPSKNSKYTLLALSLSRAAFFVLFAFCNAQPRGSDENVYFDDSVFIILMILFGFSNGYIGTLSIKYAPQFFTSAIEQKQVGKMMVFAISLGLASGAGFSFVIVSLI